MIQKSIIPMAIITTIGGIQQADAATTFVLTNSVQDTISKERIFLKMQDLIVQTISIDKAKIHLKSKIENDLGADSLDVVEIIMEIEKGFGVTIPDPIAEKIKTVEDAVNYIYQKVNEK